MQFSFKSIFELPNDVKEYKETSGNDATLQLNGIVEPVSMKKVQVIGAKHEKLLCETKTLLQLLPKICLRNQRADYTVEMFKGKAQITITGESQVKEQ